jgi:hypothetical protein
VNLQDKLSVGEEDMFKKIKLRLSGRQHAALFNHLYPGDDKETIAFALCGKGNYSGELVVCIHKIVEIPYEQCVVRKTDQVTWSTEILAGFLKNIKSGYGILKIHSHPNGYAGFSKQDDDSDKDIFKSIAGWLDTDYPGVSAIMLPDRRIIARLVDADGSFHNVNSVMVAGSDILYWDDESDDSKCMSDFNKRTVQAFGRGTTQKLSRMSIGILGVSGTGSPVAEMLARLGVGQLVLVDNDIVKDVNLGRIYNSSKNDVKLNKKKVCVIGDAIRHNELPTNVVEITRDLFDPSVIQRLAQCDIIFGCMDSIDGRNALNKLCVYYSIPYFDLGVYLEANGKGGINQACGTVHYLQPDGSSLFSRGVYTSEQLRAADMYRNNPDVYSDQVRSKYIQGVNEENPAVISLNTLIASLAVNDFLARIHQFRDEPNSDYASISVSLTQTRMITDEEGDSCSFFAKNVGRGDVQPLLDMPILSNREVP